MGTLFRIKVYAADTDTADTAFRAAFARIQALDQVMSDYKPDSELNRLSTRPTPVSEDLFKVLATAQRVAEQSHGAFDVTLGPVTRLWREARKRGHPPEPEAIHEALSRTGYRKLRLDAEKRTAWLAQPDMHLDLGGIAKGYAADAALETITGLGIRSALVAGSGDLAFSAAPPAQRGWRIELFDHSMLELTNGAVSTSGDTEQHLDAGGRRYSHIIDPKTGIGLTTGGVVTIIADHGVVADALSTAVSVLGPKRGKRLISKQRGSVRMLSWKQ